MAVLFRSKTLEDMVVNIFNNVNATLPHTRYEILQCVVSRITYINTKPPKTFEDFMNKEVTESIEAPLAPPPADDIAGINFLFKLFITIGCDNIKDKSINI